jgi:endonuclease/exonuclease/phosphatase family metal-dependent hydrolase
LTFRLMTYNILDGGEGREAAIIEVIREVAPDVVVLQEVMGPAVLERIATTLAMTHRLAPRVRAGAQGGLAQSLADSISSQPSPLGYVA